ncbi:MULTISPECIES: sensor histidine kinase [Amycolatopsis]|uniref:histidine kinase n=1 Tax=Amycolatopsis dendrobii TaxID=2760662 RepID=A0A7W3W1T4_9PSEU|nr:MULTISPECIES: HAMP domain-containing sensor histidine kinase [Amycolatopsis]MBB1157248.1 HAMP domain-containing histidine kinase [Amycolatopsis dendrobii]UKD59364.1 HAMP domain-containing histidine kinase [Amycolatopsis sp. FU40]
MSSRTRSAAARFGRRSLRAKLTLSVVVLLSLVCLVIGVISEFALRAFLLSQTDNQLSATASRALDFATHPGPPGGGERNPLDAPGQGAGTVTARFSSDGTDGSGGWLSPHGQRVTLTSDELAALQQLPTNGRPYTRTIGDLGDYRLTAFPVPDGVVITGVPLAPMQQTLLTVGLILFGVAAAGVTGAAFLGAFAVRRTLRPLERVAETASRVSELPLDRGDVDLSVRVPAQDTDPRTEVGQVGAALNHMLGHISSALEARHASELRVRRFVADASHELRTPLAAIRGYAELAGRSGSHAPPDVAHSMTRIESEADRMTALVEDLLLLARLDAGRPLDVAEVDLTRLVADAVGDAHVAGPHHVWQLAMPDEPILVLGDVQRLHQVLANLLANARVHTPPGTTVVTALSRSADGSAVVTVTDNGPGIPPELQPAVFERFARGDSSRSRAAGSTGLGLAIASAVLTAHHGAIAMRSRPGQTEFAVRLPIAVPAQRAPRADDRKSHSGHTG